MTTTSTKTPAAPATSVPAKVRFDGADPFQKQLKRKNVLTYHRDNYRNFIKFTRQLINLKPLDKEGHQRLLAEIKAADILTEREWFLNQLK